MMSEIIIAIIGTLTSLLTYFAGMRKNTADARVTENEAFKTSIEAYQMIIDDLKTQVQSILHKHTFLENEFNQIKQLVCTDKKCTKREKK